LNTIFDTRRYLIPFRTGLLPQIFCDTLVLGSGVAGLRSAISASTSGQVIVCAKESLDQTNTSWAQGGIAGVLKDDDTIEAHIEDTMTAGAGLCDREAVDLVCRQGPSRIREIIEWGMQFDRDDEGNLLAGREGGHHASRVFHSDGDATGIELQRTLIDKTKQQDNIRLFDHCYVIDLLTQSNSPNSPVLGAMTWHPKYGLQVLWARTTILAMGGAGQVYRETSNPRVATADGIAMAYRAGAELADMEFIQFHPTTLYIPGASRALISEAVRGEGAVLLDHAGHRFMPAIHKLAELAPRDVVANAIVKQLAIQGGKHVWLDCRHIEHFPERFPGIHSTLDSFGLNPAKDLIPVHPAAHYTIGGVRTDLRTRTNLPNLLAVGEVSCTGLHGANRLASNSLLEGLVMGAIAGEEAAKRVDSQPVAPSPIISTIERSNHAELDLDDVRSSLRSTMWFNAGIERTITKLDDACTMFDLWGRYTLDKVFETPDGWEVQNMLTAGALIARSALHRTHSIGAHCIIGSPIDQPHHSQSDERHRHTIWTRDLSSPRYAQTLTQSTDSSTLTDLSEPNQEPGVSNSRL